jgi:hypothetical protein
MDIYIIIVASIAIIAWSYIFVTSLIRIISKTVRKELDK